MLHEEVFKKMDLDYNGKRPESNVNDFSFQLMCISYFTNILISFCPIQL